MTRIIVAAFSFLAFQGLAQDTIQAMVLNNDSIEAAKLYNSGIRKFNGKEMNGAIADFTQAIEKQKDFHLAYMNRGSAYMEIKKFSEAVSDFNFSLNDPEACKDSYFLRGRCHMEMDNLDKAEGDFGSAITANPKDEKPYYYRGVI